MAVCEYVVLIQLRDGCSPEQAVAALEALWGLQFCLPGCLCAFGGPVLQEPAFLRGTGATHALHMRFASRQRAEAFRRHPIVEEAFRMEVAPVAKDVTEVLVEAEIEKDIDTTFRKGSEWETGAEHLLLVCGGAAAAPGGAAAASGGGDAASGFLARLAALARESRCEALQACLGPVLPAPIQQQQTGSAADIALMARFLTKQQLLWFLESPPYQALLAGDSRVPQLLVCATFELLPAERQQSKQAPLHAADL